MGRVADFAVQHLLDHPELIEASILEEYSKIWEEEQDSRQRLTRLIVLLEVSLPTELSSIQKAQEVVGVIKSNIGRGVGVKEKGLAPGVKVRFRAGGTTHTIRTIGRDFGVHLEGKAGANNPLSLHLVE